ncbi:MAG: CBS domain-containing protein [Desulfobacteraceae bacterium]|nr:MAG: CBS domain-containing protein [Desulfobacteraceae bacterium]
MKHTKVKDIMVPLAEYATVSKEATLYEAVVTLEHAQKNLGSDRYKHRAILVYDEDEKIVGKVSQMDVIRSLESGYVKVGDVRAISHSGFSQELLKSIMEKYDLWQAPLEDICRKANHLKVKEIMYTPTKGEYVSEDATLDEAIHQLIMGHHQSLLVTAGKDIVGILRLTDVFAQVTDAMKSCKV